MNGLTGDFFDVVNRFTNSWRTGALYITPRVNAARKGHPMGQLESARGASRAGPQDLDALWIAFPREAGQRWKIIAGAFILFAILIALIALSLNAPDFGENVVLLG